MTHVQRIRRHAEWHYHGDLSCGCKGVSFNLKENVFVEQLVNDPTAAGVLLRIPCGEHGVTAEVLNLSVTSTERACAVCVLRGTTQRTGMVKQWLP